MQALFINNTNRRSINVTGTSCRRNEKSTTNIIGNTITNKEISVQKERKQMNDTVFWIMMKPLISTKGSKSNSNITLIDDSKIINGSQRCFVACIISILLMLRGIGVHDPSIGSDTIDSIFNAYSDHESVLCVENNLKSSNRLYFTNVGRYNVLSVIQSINT